MCFDFFGNGSSVFMYAVGNGCKSVTVIKEFMDNGSVLVGKM